MNNGDDIVVTMRDTPNGVETFIQDQTTATSGTMIASKGNGFVHNVTPNACDTEPFDFHALYATASTAHIIPWLNLAPNVSVAFEIGHFELCSDATCSVLPPEAQTGNCSVTNAQTCNTNHGNADCPSGETCNPPCGFQRGVAGCFVTDLDHDGNSYLPQWPDGTPNHPSSLIIGSANDSGVGPMSTPTTNLTNFNEGYSTILFATTESTTGAFYPFYTQAGTGPACRFNFGNDIPDFTTADFGKAAQYTRVDLPNPCFPGVRETSLTYNGDTQNDFDDQADARRDPGRQRRQSGRRGDRDLHARVAGLHGRHRRARPRDLHGGAAPDARPRDRDGDLRRRRGTPRLDDHRLLHDRSRGDGGRLHRPDPQQLRQSGHCLGPADGGRGHADLGTPSLVHPRQRRQLSGDDQRGRQRRLRADADRAGRDLPDHR